jgi:heptosyltransferase-2
VTLADLGDTLLITPALQALRAAQPNARISLLTTPVGAAALRDLPLYDELMIFEKQRFNSPRELLRPTNLRAAWGLWRQLRRVRYDACVLLHHLTTWFGTLKYAALNAASGAPRRFGLDNGRGFFLTDPVADGGFGARHQAEYWLALIALLAPPAAAAPAPLPCVALPPAGDSAVSATFERIDPQRPLIALHPGSGAFAPARRWPVTRFAALADALIDDGAQLVLVGGPEEAELRQRMLQGMRRAAAVIDLGGRTGLSDLAYVFAQCDLFVGNDSGLAHLAGAAGAPVVAIFGPTDPHAWGPYGGMSWEPLQQLSNGVEVLHSGRHRALKATIACSPCIYRGHRLGTPNGCPDRTCLLRIDVDQVLALVRQQLAEQTQLCGSTISSTKS